MQKNHLFLFLGFLFFILFLVTLAEKSIGDMEYFDIFLISTYILGSIHSFLMYGKTRNEN